MKIKKRFFIFNSHFTKINATMQKSIRILPNTEATQEKPCYIQRGYRVQSDYVR